MQKIVHVFVGLVVNENGEVLLLNRNESELPEADKRWELPGGKVDFGESPEQALIREMREEVGAEVIPNYVLPHPFVSLWHYPDFDQHTVIMCFMCDFVSISKTKHMDHHVNAIDWVPLPKVSSLDLLPGVSFFIDQFKQIKME